MAIATSLGKDDPKNCIMHAWGCFQYKNSNSSYPKSKNESYIQKRILKDIPLECCERLDQNHHACIGWFARFSIYASFIKQLSQLNHTVTK